MDVVAGNTYAVREVISEVEPPGARKPLTETEHDIEEDDQSHGNTIHEEAYGTHPEWATRNILPSREQMWPNGHGVRRGGEDDERADQVSECSLAPQLDGSEGGAKDS